MKKKFTNPFLLGLQGFVLGAILFWASQGTQLDSTPVAGSGSATPVEQVTKL